MKKRILLVDDDVLFGSVVTQYLLSAGYDTHYQTSIVGINNFIYDFQPHIIILDVEIGTSNGIDLVPTIRALNPTIPVIFVSSHLEGSYVTRAISNGAEVYIKKPFDSEELIAYIEKYTTENTPSVLKFANCVFNVDKQELKVGDSKIFKLTTQENKLLKLLVLNINNLVERTSIDSELYGDYDTNEYSVNNSISKLRKYISFDSRLKIENEYKLGYKLVHSL